MKGWVYVIHAVGQDLFKVGYTTAEPMGRLRQLQTGCPHRLDLLAAFTAQDAPAMERTLHVMLHARGAHHRGEWFRMPREQVLDMLVHLFSGFLVSQCRMGFRSSSVNGPPARLCRAVDDAPPGNPDDDYDPSPPPGLTECCRCGTWVGAGGPLDDPQVTCVDCEGGSPPVAKGGGFFDGPF